MKFFHVYNEQFFEGLTKNGLLNEDSGFKIQHAFPVPDEFKFNRFAARGTKLHKLIKDKKIPFYIAFIYPFIHLNLLYIALVSWIRSEQGKGYVWKGRLVS